MNILILVVLIIGGGLFWTDSTEDSCWKHEATQAFEKYGSLKNRSDVLRVSGIEKNTNSNPIEVLEKDPNGCSLGSNGQTVVLFYFDNLNKLTKIQVFQNYITSDSNYKMKLIEERKF
jgi:hypothetical protein